MNQKPVVEVFFDYICPWCYLGAVRTDRLQKEYGVELKMRVFPLHPETPEEGMELSEMFAGREAMIATMQTKLAQVAAAEGVPLALISRTYNSRRAQELGKWAESLGTGNQFHKAVYRSFFVDGRNIGMIDELIAIATSVGLPPDEARTVLETGSFASAVDTDWQLSREQKITAVPTHLYVHDACATRELTFNGVVVPANHVHASYMAALGAVYAQVKGMGEILENMTATT